MVLLCAFFSIASLWEGVCCDEARSTNTYQTLSCRNFFQNPTTLRCCILYSLCRLIHKLYFLIQLYHEDFLH